MLAVPHISPKRTVSWTRHGETAISPELFWAGREEPSSLAGGRGTGQGGDGTRVLDLRSGLRAGTRFQPLLSMTSSREGRAGGGWAAGACSEKPAGPGRAVLVARRPAKD